MNIGNLVYWINGTYSKHLTDKKDSEPIWIFFIHEVYKKNKIILALSIPKIISGQKILEYIYHIYNVFQLARIIYSLKSSR